MFPKSKKRSARMRLDVFGIYLLTQTASSAQSAASPSKIEGFREFEADLSALIYTVYDNLLQDFVYMTVSIDIDISSISDAGFREIWRLWHRYR